jgi:hypothetical protein
MSDYKKILDDIISNPEKIKELTEEESLALFKKTNPYGQIISTHKTFANLSIINWRDKYFREFHLTALVGYLYRCLEEYAPHTDKSPQFVVRRDELLSVGSTDTEVAETVKAEVDAANQYERDIVCRFLDRNFEFNPDKHVKAAPEENGGDSSRPKLDDHVRDSMANASAASKVRADIGGRRKQTTRAVEDKLLLTYQSTTAAEECVTQCIEILQRDDLDLADKMCILAKLRGKLSETADYLAPLAVPLCADGVAPVYKVAPPIDTFYHLERYITNHYEQLRDARDALYCTKSDIEFAINLYDAFHGDVGADDAREHRIKYENMVICDIKTVQNNGWTLLGPFKQNRDKVEFYNKDTEVLRRMFDQMESDHKMGEQLLKDRVIRAKHENIVEAGPDDPGLSKYADACNTVKTLGAKKVLTEQEKTQYHEAVRRKEQSEVPSDAIQVDTFYVREGKLQRTKWYTKAEKPLPPDEVQKRIIEGNRARRGRNERGAAQSRDDDSLLYTAPEVFAQKKKYIESRPRRK